MSFALRCACASAIGWLLYFWPVETVVTIAVLGAVLPVSVLVKIKRLP